mmetsp:Transcript_1207/g.2600  ORF Transcript_1207/g.2600 Transcript_1207/m.2600 type:complete len:118 (-) Transcript_1207:228-581(-)|eukprot:CAMPEP_0202892926 /NCGR_PEP_ID=MMETSP1392-20130828/2594_1 /ASSEMBLY_ACC=CAM_ASM_000868 /TAXON_ID=225041 /ORGANISM="Chlamydomonas chlamydogama, Strain SAG 11-48b" /LENGTH=117 /DNA_ID=CAMNT_0049577063 /DNA_START=93 /DNA_END=446 /DNA_ORIENTATION=+
MGTLHQFKEELDNLVDTSGPNVSHSFGSIYGDTLWNAGVRSIEEVAQSNPDQLTQYVGSFYAELIQRLCREKLRQRLQTATQEHQEEGAEEEQELAAGPAEPPITAENTTTPSSQLV